MRVHTVEHVSEYVLNVLYAIQSLWRRVLNEWSTECCMAGDMITILSTIVTYLVVSLDDMKVYLQKSKWMTFSSPLKSFRR